MRNPTTRTARSLAAAALAVLLAGAGCPPEDDDLDGPIVLTDSHNYGYDGAIDAPTIETASGTDIEVCWDALLHDIQCHEMDPATDVDNLGLIRFRHLTEPEVEDAMSRDDLQQADIDGYVEWRNELEATCTTLSAFSFFGTGIDIEQEYTEGGGTYMLVLTTGTTPGIGARMIVFLAPSAGSDVTHVDIPDGCGVLDFQVDLQSLTSPRLRAEGPWELHWDGLTVDGQGEAIVPEDVDGIMLGYYEGMTLPDLQDRFLDLELIATELYTLEHAGGTEADLAEAVDADGAAFGGFHGDGIWVLALRCSACYNPAPIFLTVLDPVSQEG